MAASGNRPEPALLIRGNEAERLDTMGVRLFADHDMTGGKMSANRTVLPAGTDGAPPHYHKTSAELFFMLGGSLRVLAGEQVHTINEGDFLLVPPNTAHAWATTPAASADVLIVFTPGIERFEYFRLGDRIRKGEASPQEILDTQQRFDNYFVDSSVWRLAHHGDTRAALGKAEHREGFLSSAVFQPTTESGGQ
ncbi:cupin domain-containing protein [Nocardia tengchongensis]|uniref:cupin domain-containing protein n=1 Tax=Nocardia tengchongensis TaxID=2055889 RepID=UPI0036C90E19